MLALGRKVLKRIAKNHGVSLEDVRREIQAEIDHALDTDNLAVMIEQHKTFPDRKPSPEELVVKTAQVVSVKRHPRI